ncbi:3-keto-5-aminohexanoate cleavage protein [Actinomycetospora sp. OC33-EN08]|uniref:3-keto-5-aminohexanoate cleavage protein n=1 Tax=Actinomycetospora aurantiaca TaxID=3129233 RepID=A0ABU8MU29_9PSEU
MTQPSPRNAIITCAVTGAVHTPTMSPALPVTPTEIATASLEAHAAGAAIVHLHARDPETGRPTPDPAVFAKFLPEIRANCDAVINITTGGSVTMSLDDRLAAPLAMKPELCSLNLGSMNFNFSQMADHYSIWKYDWEEKFVRGSDDIIFKNTFRDIERILRDLGEAHGTRFEFECYDVGHLYTLAHFVERGLVRPPFFLQLIFGVRGGIGADAAHLAHMKQTADKLFGKAYVFSVFAAGRHQIPFCTMSAAMGGNVRVGLEDSLYIGRRQLAESNREQVEKIGGILADLGFGIATANDARAILQLKGADAVGF